MQWYNEPANWSVQDQIVTVKADPKTDFWRLTHDGMIRDNGHFYYQRQIGDFQADVKVTGSYAALYDHAGLMLRLDEANWMKCGIEYVDSVQYASVVVTRTYSDWSVVPLAGSPASLWLRLQRRQATIEIHYSLDGARYQLLRQAYFPEVETLDIGVMCASPLGDGFSVTFADFKIQNL